MSSTRCSSQDCASIFVKHMSPTFHIRQWKRKFLSRIPARALTAGGERLDSQSLLFLHKTTSAALCDMGALD